MNATVESVDEIVEAGKQKSTSIWRSNTELAEARWEASVEKTTELAQDGRRFLESLWARSGS